jgi:hypothetical protein
MAPNPWRAIFVRAGHSFARAPTLEAVVAKLRIGNRCHMVSSEPDPAPLLEKIADALMLPIGQA